MKNCLRQHSEKMNCSLDEIFSPIQEELGSVRDVIKEGVNSRNSTLSKICRYLLNSKGKFLRPALVLLCSKITGCRDMKRSIKIAGAIELIHTATLIHDDIIDKAIYRRDRKTINCMYGDDNAILFGDFLYSASFNLLGDSSLIGYLVNVTREICEGEISQLSLAFRNVSESRYLAMIGKKTAKLFEASCCLGANGAKSSKPLASYGYNLGMAYQIMDDCIDIVGDEQNQGKSLGRDIQEGKYTLPLIYCKKDIKDPDLRKIAIESGAIDKAAKKARLFIKRACLELCKINDSVFKNSLLEVADWLNSVLRISG